MPVGMFFKPEYSSDYREKEARGKLDSILKREEELIKSIEGLRDPGNVMPKDATKLDFTKVKFDILAKKISDYLAKNFCLDRTINRFDEKTIEASDEDIVSMENKFRFPMGHDITTYIISRLREAENGKKSNKGNGGGQKNTNDIKRGNYRFVKYVSVGMDRCNEITSVLLDILDACESARRSAAYQFNVKDAEIPVEIGGVSAGETYNPWEKENNALDNILNNVVAFADNLYGNLYKVQENILKCKEQVLKKFNDIQDPIIIGAQTFKNAVDSQIKADSTGVETDRLVNMVSEGAFNLDNESIDKMAIFTDQNYESLDAALTDIEQRIKSEMSSWKGKKENPPLIDSIISSRANNARRAVNGISNVKRLLVRYKTDNLTPKMDYKSFSEIKEETGYVNVPFNKLNGIFECIREDCKQPNRLPMNRIVFRIDTYDAGDDDSGNQVNKTDLFMMVRREDEVIRIRYSDILKYDIKRNLTENFLATDEEWYRAVGKMFIDNYDRIDTKVDSSGWELAEKTTGYYFNIKNIYRFYDFVSQNFGGDIDIGFDGDIKYTSSEDVLEAAKNSGKDYTVTLSPRNIGFVLRTMYKETFDRIVKLLTYQINDKFLKLYGVFSPYGE